MRTKQTRFECEAKYLPLDLAKPVSTLVKQVRQRITRAQSQAKSPQPGTHNLALCFVVPHIKDSRSQVLNKRCDQLIAGLRPTRGHSACDALLWIHGREFHDKDGGRCYPGMALVIKEASCKAA
jgi:hypothetical protein